MRITSIILGLSGAALLFCINPARAQILDGNSILKTCQSNTSAEQGFCLGYTIGLWTGMRLGASQVLVILKPNDTAALNASTDFWLQFCIPEGVSHAQIQDVFVKYLVDNPATRHNSARILLISSLRKTFPCKKEK